MRSLWLTRQVGARAAASLTRTQINRIERYAELVTLSLPTVELGGGSVRCMIAGVHLESRDQAEPVENRTGIV